MRPCNLLNSHCNCSRSLIRKYWESYSEWVYWRCCWCPSLRGCLQCSFCKSSSIFSYSCGSRGCSQSNIKHCDSRQCFGLFHQRRRPMKEIVCS